MNHWSYDGCTCDIIKKRVKLEIDQEPNAWILQHLCKLNKNPQGGEGAVVGPISMGGFDTDTWWLVSAYNGSDQWHINVDFWTEKRLTEDAAIAKVDELLAATGYGEDDDLPE